jgi:hypothetical protein
MEEPAMSTPTYSCRSSRSPKFLALAVALGSVALACGEGTTVPRLDVSSQLAKGGKPGGGGGGDQSPTSLEIAFHTCATDPAPEALFGDDACAAYVDGHDRVEAYLTPSGGFYFEISKRKNREAVRQFCIDFSDEVDFKGLGLGAGNPFTADPIVCLPQDGRVWTNIGELPVPLLDLPKGQTMEIGSWIVFKMDGITYRLKFSCKDRQFAAGGLGCSELSPDGTLGPGFNITRTQATDEDPPDAFDVWELTTIPGYLPELWTIRTGELQAFFDLPFHATLTLRQP